MTTTGKTILIILGIAAVGTAGYFIFRKKKQGYAPAGAAVADIPATATNPYVAADQKKKSDTGKIIGIAAGVLGTAALTALITGKKKKEQDKQRIAKGIPVTSTGINPKYVL